MKIATLLGSPRRRGNTATVLGAFERLASAEHHVERVNVIEHSVRGCVGCDACQRVQGEPGCCQRDDALALFAKLMAADVIVYAAPVYTWSFPAQMKALLDRHYCLIKWSFGSPPPSLLQGKRVALLVTCGGEAADNADLVQVEFEREMAACGCSIFGRYVVDLCTTPAALGERAEAVARVMARDLAGLR